MLRKTSGFIAALALFAVAGLAVAQNADQNTGGPTKNTLKLRLIEPLEGATITGDSVRVAVDYNHDVFGAGQGTKFGEANFPQPRFDIFLDNTLKITLKGTEANTTVLEAVPAGVHKIVVIAKNVSGEIIDRKEVTVTTSPSVVVEAAPAPRAPAPAPAYQPPPAPAPVYQPAPAPPAPVEATLPKTASSAPQMALLGLGLVAVGLLIGRKAS
jgi:LPXTG-motif cell wall-anchored protein